MGKKKGLENLMKEKEKALKKEKHEALLTLSLVVVLVGGALLVDALQSIANKNPSFLEKLYSLQFVMDHFKTSAHDARKIFAIFAALIGIAGCLSAMKEFRELKGVRIRK